MLGIVFFFFQAEDGIRDRLVTGVQTCALPIFIEAANCFGRFFTGQMTAAGKTQPAKVLVIGAGVAGLSAMGAAVGLGAIVRAFDTRLEVREQIQSMGAEFLLADIEEDGGVTAGYARLLNDEIIYAETALFEIGSASSRVIV